jgi:hypothetical protein
MGEIISSRLLGSKVIYKILLDLEEAMNLKNALRNVHLFSEDYFFHEAKIIERGKGRSTKYFQIPFSLRFRKKKLYESVSYLKLETSLKTFFVYIINKSLL